MTAVIRALLFAVLALLGCGVEANAAKRLALLIGINKYDNLPANKQLRNAVNDVHTLGDTLRKLDFAVDTVIDPDLDRMIEAVNRLALDALPGDTVLFFFSGHGISPDNVNLLLPRDFPALTAGGPTDRERARRAAYAENDVISALRTKLSDVKTGQQRGLIVFISDACRDDPFSRRSQGTKGIAAIPQGVEAKPTEGVFSIYSAGLGQTALDGISASDRNSVFMSVFASMLPTPGRHLGDLMAEVKEVVAGKARTYIDEDTGRPHVQVPAIYDETLGGRIFLSSRSGEPPPQPPPPTVVPAPAVPTPVVPNPQEQTALQRELAGDRRYLDCVRKDDIDCYQALLDEFPEHTKVEQVRTLIRAKTELPRYQACLNGNSPGDRLRLCDLYINAFPKGRYRGDAETLREQAMLDLRPLPQAQPQPPALLPPRTPPAVALPPPAPSFSCARASLPAEIAVCGSPLLASLDVRLGASFSVASRGSGASAVRDRQRAWLQRRNACGSDAGCLEASYREQIRWLESWQSQPASLPPQPANDIRPSFPCDKAGIPAEYAVCGSATLARLDVQLAQLYARARASSRAAYFRSAQQAWMARRNACGANASCLERLYREQIALLSQ